jgi:hypothetical protein
MSSVAPRDRLRALLEATNTTYNGIDFVEVVGSDELTLRVHFHTSVSLTGEVQRATISGGEVIKSVEVLPIDNAHDWAVDAEDRPLLTLRVNEAGDFSTYILTLLTGPTAVHQLDAFYSKVPFSFKAGCKSDLDCGPADAACPTPLGDIPPIDYLAKDFYSFRKALSDFSAQRYPRWDERSEADLGMVMIEVMSAVADDLSYSQDRIAAEATLDTATQRRSIVRLARLVDYEPRPIRSAAVTLQFDVDAGPIPPGVVVMAEGADGNSIPFETDPQPGDPSPYTVDPTWNSGIAPYYWDDSVRCLQSGATEMWVLGHGFRFGVNQPLLIDSEADTSADPHVRQIVHLAETAPGHGDHAVEERDPLFGNDVTHIRWTSADRLRIARDLARTTLAGNLIPASQGRTFQEFFAIPPDAFTALPAKFSHVPLAVTRTGPNSTPDNPVPQYQHTLRGGRLGWRQPAGLDAAPIPEIEISQVAIPPATLPAPWDWTMRLLDADGFAAAYTLESASYRPTASGAVALDDYAGDDGDTVRFGDNNFGRIPAPGTVMRVRYRTSVGKAGNVAADSIRTVEPTTAARIKAVTNPFPAAGGDDAEPNDSVRRLAPQAFRAQQFRAVRPEDYVIAARRLPWVEAAGSTFRWTGSWMTVFTTPDPAGREGFASEQGAELVHLLNRYRLAGYESYVLEPVYVPVDLAVTVCAKPDAYRAEVKVELLTRLGAGVLPDGKPAFFNPSQFTFGTPLVKGRLEQAVQSAPGVSGILSIQYRRRDTNPDYIDLQDEGLQFGHYEILRLDNDPNRPNMGSLHVYVDGGK